MKNNLFLKLSFGLSFLLIASTAQANCMWTLNDKCLDIGTTVKWTESTASNCSGTNKLNGTTNKCCCAAEVDGCCEKTQGTTVNAVNLTGEKCAKISYASTTFFQDRQALNNICVEKSAVSCSWKGVTSDDDGSVSGGCSTNDTLSDKNKCPSPEPKSGVSNKTYQCCCQSTNVTYVKPAPTPAQPKFIVPELSIAIPGLKSFSSSSIEYIANDDGSFSVSIPWLAQYIKAFYNYGLSIIGILAALVMIAGGILWLISAGNDSKITKAKELIIGSVSGIIIFAASYLILIQINPDLIENKSIVLGSVKANILDISVGNETPELPSGSSKAFYECAYKEYGNSEQSVRQNLVTVKFLGMNYTVHNKMASALNNAQTQIEKAGITYKSTDTAGGGFNWRTNVNDTKNKQLSFHSFGIAIDINPNKNPNYRPKETPCKTDMPQELINILKNNGFRWGGEYKSVCDSMHFEWVKGNANCKVN